MIECTWTLLVGSASCVAAAAGARRARIGNGRHCWRRKRLTSVGGGARRRRTCCCSGRRGGRRRWMVWIAAVAEAPWLGGRGHTSLYLHMRRRLMMVVMMV